MHFQQRQRTLCVQKAWKTPKNLLVLLEFSDGGLRSLQRRRESARYLLVVATSIYIVPYYYYYYIRVMFSNKKSSFMAGILIQAPFITKKWIYIIKNGQRPRGLEQEGLKGQKFLAG